MVVKQQRTLIVYVVSNIYGLICSEVYYISGCTHEYDINAHAGVHMSMCACMCAHLSILLLQLICFVCKH